MESYPLKIYISTVFWKFSLLKAIFARNIIFSNNLSRNSKRRKFQLKNSFSFYRNSKKVVMV